MSLALPRLAAGSSKRKAFSSSVQIHRGRRRPQPGPDRPRHPHAREAQAAGTAAAGLAPAAAGSEQGGAGGEAAEGKEILVTDLHVFFLLNRRATASSVAVLDGSPQ